MANTLPESGAASASADLSLGSRFVGIITSPKATFQAVVAHPRWLGMLLLTIVLSAMLVGGFMLTKVGQEAWLDAAIARSGQPMSDQQVAGLERFAPYLGYVSMASIAVFVPLMYLMASGLLFA